MSKTNEDCPLKTEQRVNVLMRMKILASIEF